jgi:hypothetical protein
MPGLAWKLLDRYERCEPLTDGQKDLLLAALYLAWRNEHPYPGEEECLRKPPQRALHATG